MVVAGPGACARPLGEAVAAAVRGGADAVQVRAPGLPAGDLLRLVRELAPAVRDGGARLIVNDRVDVALAAGADGVHLKAASLPPGEVRGLVGDGLLVGVSTHRAGEVAEAFAGGADYVVFGPVFATPSKAGVLAPRGAEAYRAVAACAAGPVLALGGIDAVTLRELLPGPLPGIAVVRAVLAAPDPEAAARELRRMLPLREDR